jgi:alpha-1,2-mannosyltransferase
VGPPSPAVESRHQTGWRGRSLDALRLAWTPRRVRIWVATAIVAAWLPVVGVPARGFLDTSAFYTAARFAFTPDVVRLEPIVLAQQAAGMPISPYLYTPLFALLYVPLTWLPYALAGAISVGLMFAALIAAALLGARLFDLPVRWALLGTLAWAPAAASVLGGQNATFALLLAMVVGVLMVHTARWETPLGRTGAALVGMLIGLLAYKPQFAAPLAGLALLRRRWLVVGVTVLALAMHYLISVVVAGGNAAWPLDWLATLSGYSAVDLATNGWQAISLPSLLARIQPGPAALAGIVGLQGYAIVGYALGGVLILLLLAKLIRLPLPRALALAMVLGLLITPHAWVYNATLLLPAMAVFAGDAVRRGWPWQDRWLLVVAYAIGLTWPLGGVVGVTAVPLVLLLAVPLLAGWRPFSAYAAGAATGADEVA